MPDRLRFDSNGNSSTPAATHLESPPGADDRQRHVLLVEDVLLNQTLLQNILIKHHYDVAVAHDGLEAVELARTQPFDIVLMDVQLPHMSGLEATAAIRQLPRGSDIPIVAVTALARPGDRERLLAAGMDDYVSKPVDGEALLALVDRLTHEHGTEVGS